MRIFWIWLGVLIGICWLCLLTGMVWKGGPFQ
jgi:hypothetical protein